MTRTKPPAVAKPAPSPTSGATIPEAVRRQRGQRGLFLRLTTADLDRLASLARPGEGHQDVIRRKCGLTGQAKNKRG
jgi:hypothetical protein